jgi:hypothetical protein
LGGGLRERLIGLGCIDIHRGDTEATIVIPAKAGIQSGVSAGFPLSRE